MINICRRSLVSAFLYGTIVALGAPLVHPALAFDCKKASSPIEKATCADPIAKASDDAMSEAFAALKTKLDPAQAKMLLANQRRWLKSRASEFASVAAPKQAAFVETSNTTRAKLLSGQAEAGPGLAAPLMPVFVERPASPKSYDVSVLLYRSWQGTKERIDALDRSTAQALTEVPTKVEDPQDGAAYSYEVHDKITYGSPALLSIVRGKWQFDGGAHGQSSSEGLNIDPRTGRLFEMADVLPPQGLKEVTTLCLQQIKKQAADKAAEGRDPGQKLTAEDRKAEGETVAGIVKAAEPMIKDLKIWHFEAARAVVVFDADTIAAHAFSEFECEVPYAALKTRVKTGFPLP